jgi:hypothetical protein
MKAFPFFCLAWFTGALSTLVEAQTYDTNNVVVQTFAGSGFSGYVDDQGTLTMFNGPSSIVCDSSGNLFVADSGNERIRKITPDGTVSTFAGGGASAVPGFGTNVSLASFTFGSMAIDHSNALLIAYGSSNVLRIESNAYVSRLLVCPTNANGGICVDSDNNIYTTAGRRIFRRSITGVIEVFAGSGNSGSVDGNGIFTSFSNPAELVADAANNIYVWDSGGNQLMRRVDQNREVVTVAGKKGVTANADGI